MSVGRSPRSLGRGEAESDCGGVPLASKTLRSALRRASIGGRRHSIHGGEDDDRKRGAQAGERSPFRGVRSLGGGEDDALPGGGQPVAGAAALHFVHAPQAAARRGGQPRLFFSRRAGISKEDRRSE